MNSLRGRMKCFYCKKEIPDTSKFCNECGKEIKLTQAVKPSELNSAKEFLMSELNKTNWSKGEIISLIVMFEFMVLFIGIKIIEGNYSKNNDSYMYVSTIFFFIISPTLTFFLFKMLKATSISIKNHNVKKILSGGDEHIVSKAHEIMERINAKERYWSSSSKIDPERAAIEKDERIREDVRRKIRRGE